MFFDAIVPEIIARALILGASGLVWVIVVVRLIGLRTFSKMTAFDFVATVATGSLLAGAAQASTWPTFFQANLSILVILGVQFVVAYLRRASHTSLAFLQNTPIVLMRDGVIGEDALTRTRVSRGDLIAKLREANVLRASTVRAVVLETTGDISVLHGDTLEP
ncbi:DUF421 domain-containing protein [Rhodobacteraceae bacterium N5(2021)]|uniref:DUF421 domain-containing protein n=1 Tax=Gymnodinialimonas phycosphaerae TaxID=2841589 RepID=A0A975TSP8_9RHOB|nr:YetF domain-containing protein [Gymnodinialimonas phycosphaerae]MBY4894103.1 DUF421 domain-containing protein [Gymnodinialimonas phycosphaerae]